MLEKTGIGEVTVTRFELADLLGVTPQSISQLKRRGLPALAAGDGYNLLAAVRWYVKWTEQKASGTDLDEQETRERIRKLQIQNAAAMNKLVDRDIAMRHVERGITEVGGTLDCLPARVAALVPKEYRAEVEESVRDLMVSARRSLEGCKEFASEDKIELPEEAEPAGAEEAEPDKEEETHDE